MGYIGAIVIGILVLTFGCTSPYNYGYDGEVFYCLNPSEVCGVGMTNKTIINFERHIASDASQYYTFYRNEGNGGQVLVTIPASIAYIYETNTNYSYQSYVENIYSEKKEVSICVSNGEIPKVYVDNHREQEFVDKFYCSSRWGQMITYHDNYGYIDSGHYRIFLTIEEMDKLMIKLSYNESYNDTISNVTINCCNSANGGN